MTTDIQSSGRHSNKDRGSSKINFDDKTSSQRILIEIAIEMSRADLSTVFIVNAVSAAMDFEGIADLMKLWKNEDEQNERNEIVADIQDMLDACAEKEKVEEFYVRFNDLRTIANNIRAFKDSLLSEVDKNGGIKRLAELTDIPQPSLSRFFNTNSMPQRSTLLKIAQALNIDELRIDYLWEGKSTKR